MTPSLKLIHKPEGISVHRPSDNIAGIVDVLPQSYYICHRLDKGTSGALVLATTPEAAKILTDKFTRRSVKKKYYFVTDRQISKKELIVKSYIQRKKNTYQLHSQGKDSEFSETQLTHIKTIGDFHLWSAQPITGKTHQIRLHAQSAGIPILGDDLYDGTKHCRLFLHSYQLEIDDYTFTSPLPHLMENLELLKNDKLSSMICSVERRRLLYPDLLQNTKSSLRLIHSENPNLRCDQFGDRLWFYWYGSELPRQEDLNNCQWIARFCQKQDWFLRVMLNRGKHPNRSLLWHNGEEIQNNSLDNELQTWQAQENGIQYEFRTESGLSPGLFLDQRQNRRWVQENSRGQKVLNLFAYTAGFSLSAAKGEASEVTTVDLSKNFIQWSQKNFELNGYRIDTSQFEFWASDALLFLKGCEKRERKFDLIICDPPTFSRSGSKVFQIEKKYSDLLSLIINCLNPGGRILFCTNYEKWSTEDLSSKLQQVNPHLKEQLLPLAGLDYEMPGKPPILKSTLLKYK